MIGTGMTGMVIGTNIKGAIDGFLVAKSVEFRKKVEAIGNTLVSVAEAMALP